MREWLVQTERRYPGIAVLTIHDSLVLETSSKAKVQAVQRLGEQLGGQMFDVPMAIDLKEWGK
jgi:hypothetical protein